MWNHTILGGHKRGGRDTAGTTLEPKFNGVEFWIVILRTPWIHSFQP